MAKRPSHNKPETQGVQNHPQLRDVNAAQRVATALKLRAHKARYEDIATACGYGSAGAAHKAIMRELQRVIVANATELRREEADSLDRLEYECWKRLEDTEYASGMLFAVDRIIAIKERRAKLLGLDTPIDQAQAANIVVIREVPANYLTGPAEPTV